MAIATLKININAFRTLYTPSTAPSKAHNPSQAAKDKVIIELFQKHKVPPQPPYVTKDYKFNNFKDLVKEIKEKKLGCIKFIKHRFFETLSPNSDKSPLKKDELSVLRKAYHKGVTSWSQLSEHLFKTAGTPKGLYRSADFLKNHRSKFIHLKKRKVTLLSGKTSANKKLKSKEKQCQETPLAPMTVTQNAEGFVPNPVLLLDQLLKESDLTEFDTSSPPIDARSSPADSPEVRALLSNSRLQDDKSHANFPFYRQEKDPFDAIATVKDA